MRAITVGCLILLLASPTPSRSQDPPQGWIEITGEAQAAIDRGLEFLATRQSVSGAFGNGSAPMATTALAGLAFLAAGHGPGRSKYGDVVEKVLTYVMDHRGRNGYINEGGGKMRGQGGSGLHGHGYATLFLAELYGLGGVSSHRAEEVKEALQQAVDLIEASQSPNGGWNYEPKDGGGEGAGTITMVMPLGAAKNAGIQVDLTTIEKAVKYIDQCTMKTGMTQYSLTRGAQTSWALTAAGQSVMTYLGKTQDDRVAKGLEYLTKNAPFQDALYTNKQAWGSWYFYGSLYATIAMYQAGGRRWAEWFPKIRDELVKRQEKSGGVAGAWTGGEGHSYGPEFSSACALLMLEVPCRYLPILQSPED